MSGRKWRQRAVIGMAFLLSAFFLWLALRQVDAQGLKQAFFSIKFVPALLCAMALLAGIVLRAIRWRVIAGFPLVEQRNFSYATNLGVLANLLLPARVGELVRVATLVKLSRSTLPGPLASALIDRLVDVFVLLASALVVYQLSPISAILGKWLTVLLVVGSVIVLLMIMYARSSGIGEVLIAKVTGRALRAWQLQPEVFLAELRAEFRRLLGGWLNLKVVGLALLILCVDYGAIATLLIAFGLSLPPEAPLLLWVCLAAGSALPSAPGYVGIYQVAAIWSLSGFSVLPSVSVAIAATLQVITLAVVLAVAVVGWIRIRSAIPDISKILRDRFS